MSVQKIKERLRNGGDAVQAVTPDALKDIEPEEEKKEDKTWHNPELLHVLDYDLTEGGNGENILQSLQDPDKDYRSKKSLSQFREFFYDMVKSYEKFENNQ